VSCSPSIGELFEKLLALPPLLFAFGRARLAGRLELLLRLHGLAEIALAGPLCGFRLLSLALGATRLVLGAPLIDHALPALLRLAAGTLGCCFGHLLQLALRRPLAGARGKPRPGSGSKLFQLCGREASPGALSRALSCKLDAEKSLLGFGASRHAYFPFPVRLRPATERA